MKVQEKIYDARILAYVKEEKSLDDSILALFNIIWGKCSAMMQNRLESVNEYESIVADADVASLLKEIRNVSNDLQVSANIYMHSTKQKQSILSTIRTMTNQIQNGIGIQDGGTTISGQIIAGRGEVPHIMITNPGSMTT